MSLSNELISQFIKVTNDNSNKKSDKSTSYGTAVEYNGSMYVQLDGSDLLTPVDTSTTLHDKDRVIVDITNHNATATGNISNPSVSGVELTQTEGTLRLEFEQGLRNLELFFKDEMAKLDIGFADGIYAGITSVDKDGIKVSHTAYNGYTHMAYDGFYINYGGADVLKCTANGLVYTGTITASDIKSTDGTFKIDKYGNINGASFKSSKGDNFSIDENGIITASALAVEGNVSSNTIICNEISNKAYPKALSSGINLNVNKDSGNDDSDCINGATFKTLQGAIDSLPRNLNGKVVNIYMKTYTTENVTIKYLTSGRLFIFMEGHTLYGHLNFYHNTTATCVYGGFNSSDTATQGVIHPSVGVDAGSVTSSVFANGCRLTYIQYVDLYAADNHASGVSGHKVGVSGQGGGFVYCKRIHLINCNVGFRVYSGTHLHCSSSSGIATVYGFQTATGAQISLANANQSGGNTANTNKASGGQIWTDSCTFSTGSSTSSSSTAQTAQTTKTKTFTSSSAQALQYAGTSSAFWRTDCKPKAGDWGYGAHTGWWFFGDDFEDVASKNVSKIEITFTREKAGYHSATACNFYVHNYEAQPSTKSPSYNTSRVASASVAASTTYTISITDATIINRIKAAKGICTVPTSQNSTYYSVFSGTMKVKFTYKE